MFNMCKIKKKRMQNKKIQCLTSKWGPAHPEISCLSQWVQSTVTVQRKYLTFWWRRGICFLFEPAPLSWPLPGLWLLMAVTCGFLLHLVHPSRKASLQAHSCFSRSLPHMSWPQSWEQGQSPTQLDVNRHRRAGGVSTAWGSLNKGVRSRQITPPFPVGQRTSLLLLEIYPQTSYADE